MPLEHSMTCIAPTVAEVLGLPAPAQATGAPIPEIVSALKPAERLAILAPDALGEFAWRLWREEMPFLKSLSEQASTVLRAVMPTITPVNFATMVAGADKSVHGIGAFTDDFQCETLFDVVRAHGGKSAGVGQKGYTGSELLGRNADIRGTAASNTDDEVETIALDIAREHQPQFIIVQLGSTDDIFHQFGPSSAGVVPKLQETDGRLQRMTEALTPLGYAIIITADHGQHDTESGGSHGTDADEDALVPCVWVR